MALSIGSSFKRMLPNNGGRYWARVKTARDQPDEIVAQGKAIRQGSGKDAMHGCATRSYSTRGLIRVPARGAIYDISRPFAFWLHRNPQVSRSSNGCSALKSRRDGGRWHNPPPSSNIRRLFCRRLSDSRPLDYRGVARVTGALRTLREVEQNVCPWKLPARWSCTSQD